MIHALVCDDYDPILQLITVVLTGMGIKVTGAEEGGRARDLVHKLRPDLIISDVDMPGLDGISLFKEVQLDTTGLAQVPFVLMSSVDRQKEALEAGCHCFLTKPFSIEDVRYIVRKAIDSG